MGVCPKSRTLCIVAATVLALIISSVERPEENRIPAHVQVEATHVNVNQPILAAAFATALSPATLQPPVTFERNCGQIDNRVQYIARGQNCTLYLTTADAVLSLGSSTVRIRCVHAQKQVSISGLDEQFGRSNYILGAEADDWHTDIPHFARVKYESIYPGIDLIFHGSQRQLEYDFHLAPGADPKAIVLEFDGATAMSLDDNGSLLLATASGTICQHAPIAYQISGGRQRKVEAHYAIEDTRVRFDLGEYDPALPLVIDPVLSYSTFVGGSGAESLGGMSIDSAGNCYIAGRTASLDFPITIGDPGNQAGSDAYIMKISPSGTVVYSTYIGGADFDSCNDIAIDGGGTAYICGTTYSANFPVVNSDLNDGNNFVAKLSADGSSLFYSIKCAGSAAVTDIAVDGNGRAYITGFITSGAMPLVNPLQANRMGFSDAIAAAIAADGRSYVYSTYLGGSDEDNTIFTIQGGASSIAVDANGNAYIAGYTASTDFPVTAGAMKSVPNSIDIFVTKLTPEGSIVFATLFGGGGVDMAGGIALDVDGNIYLGGKTGSEDFPMVNAFQSTPSGSGDAFVAKLNPTATTVLFSSFIGGSEPENSLETNTGNITVDTMGNMFLCGYTASADFPTLNPIQNSNSGLKEVFIAKINASGSLAFSTYFGGVDEEHAVDIGVDATGNIYVAGVTRSADFPTLNAIKNTTDGVERDAFILRLTENSSPSMPDAFNPPDEPTSPVTPSEPNEQPQLIAPQISGNFSVTTKIGASFTYVIRAEGSPTISYVATPLPTGLSLTGNIVSGAITAAGSYSVLLQATNAAGSDTKSLQIAVLDGTGSESDVDSDGDGIPDELEVSLGSDPLDPGSGPLGVNNSAIGIFSLTQFSIGVNFTKDGRDTVTMKGTLPVPAGFSPDGQTVVLDIGGIVRSFTLNGKGAGPKGRSETFFLKVKTNKTGVPAQSASFRTSVKNGTFRDFLRDERLVTVSEHFDGIFVPIIVIFNEKLYRTDATVATRFNAAGVKAVFDSVIRR